MRARKVAKTIRTATTWLLALIASPSFVGAQVQTETTRQGEPRAAAQLAPAPTAPAPPIALGVNGALSPWLQVRGEFRARVEGFSGGGLTENEDAYWLDRFRLNATVRAAKSMLFVVQAHDARTFRKKVGSQTAPFRDTLDLRMAYGEVGTTHSVRIGRQELAFGEQRLLGHLAWVNTGRSFDGARMTLKGGFGQIDAFAASVVTIDPEGFDKSGNGNLITGGYSSFVALLPKQLVEPYFFWRHARGVTSETGGTAALHEATGGVRLAGKVPWSVDYSGEIALQRGSLGTDDVSAWAGHIAVGKTLGSTKGIPRAFGEYNFASGDTAGTDGTRGTFDQLYPTGHDKLGLSDQVGWKNIHHARAGLELRPRPKWQVSGSYHSWWLASTTDGLYSASGALVARSPAGTAGRHVGQEVDGQLAYTYSPQLQLAAGYAHVLPGQFLENMTPGRSYRSPYLMVTYVFLGETPAIGGRRTQ